MDVYDFILPYHYCSLNTCCSNHSKLGGRCAYIGKTSVAEILSEINIQKRNFCSELNLLISFSLEYFVFNHLTAVDICNVLILTFLSFLSQLQLTLYPADVLCLFLLMCNAIWNCDYHLNTQVTETFLFLSVFFKCNSICSSFEVCTTFSSFRTKMAILILNSF